MSDFKVWSFLVQRPIINITLMVDLAIHAYVEPVYDMLDMSLLVSTWIKSKTAWHNWTSYDHCFAELYWSAEVVCESSLLSLHQGLKFLATYLPDSAMAVLLTRISIVLL